VVAVLDTNILVRVFLEDVLDEKQTDAARALLKKTSEVYIPQLVQAELMWVLKYTYKLTKPKLLAIFKKLGSHSSFTLQNHSAFSEALALYEAGPADFSDYLVLVEASKMDAEVHTFDKKFAKSGAVLVS